MRSRNRNIAEPRRRRMNVRLLGVAELRTYRNRTMTTRKFVALSFAAALLSAPFA